MIYSRKNIAVWLVSVALCCFLLSLLSCTDNISVDYKIDDSKIDAQIPDSLIVTVGRTAELYIPVPTYDGRKVTEADIHIGALSHMEDIASVCVVNDSTFIINGRHIGTALVDITYGTYKETIVVDVVDEMIRSFSLSVDNVDLYAMDSLDVTYTVDPEEFIDHRLDISIPGDDDATAIYQAYSDTPGHILLRAVDVGQTALTFRIDTCIVILPAISREMMPQSIRGEYIGGTWKLSEGQTDSSQFYVVPDNTTYPELKLTLIGWQPEDLCDITVTDNNGRNVGTVKSNYTAVRDSVGDPVLTVNGAAVPYRDSAGNVISYSNAQISSRCVYTPKIEDYLIYEGERFNNFKMTGLKACSATFSAPVKKHPEVTCTFTVKVSGGTHNYTED